jgi:hypothetical protein
MIISNNYRLGNRVEECGNYELEQEIDNRVFQQNSSLCYGISEAGNNVNYQFDYDDLEIQQRNIRSFDLSHILEEQKYLRITPSDNDDSIKLETINGREYFVKLKELEMNDLGEFVMTLKSMKDNLFLGQNSDNSVIKNLAINDLENQHGMLKQEQLLQQSFVKIDTVLSSVFKNLQHEVK